jgi:hypothetical protein
MDINESITEQKTYWPRYVGNSIMSVGKSAHNILMIVWSQSLQFLDILKKKFLKIYP